MPERCAWVPESDPLYVAYHDDEWGVPERDDRALYELLTLEGAQAGLSWSTILHKREGYRKAFVGFDRVQPLILELVGADLVRQADAAPLLIEIQQDTPPLGSDASKRGIELRAAIASG